MAKLTKLLISVILVVKPAKTNNRPKIKCRSSQLIHKLTAVVSEVTAS